MNEQPTVSVGEESRIIDKQEKTILPKSEDKQEETMLPTNEDKQEETKLQINEDKQEESYINIEDSTELLPIDNQINDIPSFVHSRSLSPRNEEQPFTQINHDSYQPIASQFSITPSLNSSTAPLTPIDPSIRVEISEKTKPFIPVTQHVSQTRKELTPAPPPPPPPPSSQTHRFRKQPNESINRTPTKVTVSDQSTGKRYLDFYIFFFYSLIFFFSHSLLPNNLIMWDSYAKQNGIEILSSLFFF